jgi:D-psicose/D-tagatose/L-ribulose 3-epimerase
VQFGLNLLLWTDTLNDQALPLLDQIRKIGYDAVEIPIFECDVAKYARWGKRLDDAGLVRTGVTVRGVDDNPMSPDPAVRRKGVEANKAALDCAAAAGCRALVGPYHSALGYFSGAGPTADEWQWAVASMRQVAEHAETCGVWLGLEYLNRFECYLLNTADDGARFSAEVNHPRCKMMYDTFHSHIEEKNTARAIRALRDCLVHVHISENDRSTPGQGNVRWAENFDTLHEIGYDGLMVVEAFGLALDKLVAATKIWRRMYQSEQQLAGDALRFMKAEVAKRWKS